MMSSGKKNVTSPRNNTPKFAVEREEINIGHLYDLMLDMQGILEEHSERLTILEGRQNLDIEDRKRSYEGNEKFHDNSKNVGDYYEEDEDEFVEQYIATTPTPVKGESEKESKARPTQKINSSFKKVEFQNLLDFIKLTLYKQTRVFLKPFQFLNTYYICYFHTLLVLFSFLCHNILNKNNPEMSLSVAPTEDESSLELVGESQEVDWNALSGGEIYDRFTVKGAKLGHQANRMLRLLKQKNFIAKECPNTLGKVVKERNIQRSFFVNLLPEGLALLRNEMTKYSNPDAAMESSDTLNIENERDIPKNIRARAWHLADDPQSVGFLELIFGGVSKVARRTFSDDKSVRTENQWKILCDSFFNCPSWNPENQFDDSRVADIDPSKPPLEDYQPEMLRKLFSRMRSQYSIFNDRYHRSGHLLEGDGDGDDDFFHNYARGDTVYLYAHLLFKGQPPRFCTRDNSFPCDVGVTPIKNRSDSVSTSGSSSQKKKRKRQDKNFDLTREDYFALFGSQQTKEQCARDKHIGAFFALQQIQSTMSSPVFADLPSETQNLLKRRYTEMLHDTFEK